MADYYFYTPTRGTFMPIIPYNDLNDGLNRRRDPAIDVPYEVIDGRGRPTPPGGPTGRPMRPLQPQSDPFGNIGAIADILCDIRRVSPQRFRQFVTVSPFDIIPPVQRARERLWQSFCNERPDNQPPLEIPFNGGQCPGVEYRVSTQYVWYNNPATCSPINGMASVPFWGPILNYRVILEDAGGGDQRITVDVYCAGPSGGPILDLDWFRALTGNGSSSACPTTNLTSFVVTREDGLPDDCGDPFPDINPDPGDEPPLPPDISLDIQIGNNNTFNIPIDVTQDDFIDIDFGDININFDGINIDIGFGGNGDGPPSLPIPSDPVAPPPGQGDGGGKPQPDDTTTDPDDPDPPPPPSGDDPATEEPPEEPPEVIRAVLVTVTSVDPASSVIYQDDNPDVYIPDLGVVNFRCRARDGASGWTPDQRVKNLRCFIVCEWDGGAFEVKGTPRPGVQWTLTPIIDLSSIPVI